MPVMTPPAQAQFSQDQTLDLPLIDKIEPTSLSNQAEPAEHILPITEQRDPVFLPSVNESDSSSKMSLSDPHPVNHFYAVTPRTRYPGTKQPMEQQASLADCTNETPMMPMQEACVAPPRKRPCIEPLWQWKKNDISNSENIIYTPKEIHYTKAEKILAKLPASPTPLCYFRQYITDEIISHAVTETNRYADQYIKKECENLKPRSNVHTWNGTSRNEMYTLIALLVLMGVVYKPRLHLYWSRDEIYYTPLFHQVMARDRFFLMIKFFHLANNEKTDLIKSDRLYKIREFINLIRNNCRSVYYPGPNLCVDESLVLFKGRLSFKQYIRTKRARYGIKLYQLCSSNGLLLDFLVYFGQMNSELEQTDGMLTTERIPITLMKPYLNHGHTLYVDNFYTTPKLAEYMLQNGTKLVGTIRNNRQNFPKELAKSIPDKGHSIFYVEQNRKVLVVQYRSVKNKTGNKPKIVFILSTGHKASIIDTGRSECYIS